MSDRRAIITYENGRKVFTNSYDEKPTVQLSIALGDEEVGGSAVPSTSIDERLALAGLMDSEKERFKEKLLKQHLENLNNDITVPVAPTTSPLINQMKIANDLKHQKETREIKLAEVDTEYKKTDIQTKLKQLELQKQSNSSQDAMLIMMGETYMQNERMIAGFERINANLGELRGTLSSINTKLKSQEEVNVKQLEKLKQELEKNISIDGKNVNSLELEQMKNKELYTSASDENNFTLDEGLEAVEEILTDGFDLSVNPLVSLLELVKQDFEKEINEIEVKYNIKEVK